MRESYSRTFFKNEAVSRDSTTNPERFTSQRFFTRLRSLASCLCAVPSFLLEQFHAAKSKSLSSTSSVGSVAARLPSTIAAVAPSKTATFSLDISAPFYLNSQRYENPIFPRGTSRRDCRFSDRPTSSHMHGCGSGKTRRRNSNDHRQGGRRSPVRERQHFPEPGRQEPESNRHRLYSSRQR